MYSWRNPDRCSVLNVERAIRICLSLALSALVAATAAPVGAKNSTTPANAESAVNQSEALEVAAQLAGRITDVEFRSRFSLSLVEFQSRQGHFRAAAELAESIPDYRRGVALAKVASALAHAGKADESAALIRKVKEPEDSPHPWQSEAVLAEVAVAWEAAERGEEASVSVGKLTDESARIRARSGIALEKARRGEAYDEAAFQFPSAEAKPGPERLQAARALLEFAELKASSAGKNREALHAVAPVCEQVEVILTASRAAAAEEHLDLGLLWRRIGNFEKSAGAVSQALRQMPPGVELHDWRAGYFAKLVRAYMDAGDRGAAETLLARARQGIPSLHEFYRPPALCQLAEAEFAAGQPQQAEQTWLEAARIAHDNPNPSSQYLGCAQVAFSIARANRPLGADLKHLLTAQKDRRTQPASIVEN